MRGIFSLIVILIISSSCQDSPKAGNSVSFENSTPSSKLMTGDSTLLDNYSFPDKEKQFPMQLLYIDNDKESCVLYHYDEVSEDWINRSWYALVKNGPQYFIQNAAITIRPGYDPVLDDDTTQKTGWEVCTNATDTPLIHFTEYAKIKAGPIGSIKLPIDIIRTGDTISFEFASVMYKLFATGIVDNNSSEYSSTTNYRLFIESTTPSKKTTQLLFAAPNFDDAFPSIMFIGDINRDGLPDILLNAVRHYNEFAPSLFLSNSNSSDPIWELVGLHWSSGC
ncbi:MAG: hypothetical protein H3C54_08885 [Taibaiella sp.]|nr:hypothetical protein [Taibaiella sp.]